MTVQPQHLYTAFSRLRRRGVQPSVSAVVRDHRKPADAYRFDPIGYIREKMGWEPWQGDSEHPGQIEILAWYELALRQQFERQAYQLGHVTREELRYWQPGQIIQNWARIEAGHTVGKTKLASGIVNHFYDSFKPSVGYTFAPTEKQVHDLLWKEIKSDRSAAGDLPGRIMDLELRRDYNHFMQGRATDNSGGKGTERVQGQHSPYQIYVLDEAEGIEQYVYDSLDSLTSGGISIVILLGNPRTRVSNFYRAGNRPEARSFRISCLYHPNVATGRPVIPDAVSRDYVNRMIRTHCEPVPEHDPDEYTFTVQWEVPKADGTQWAAGTIFLPDAEFMFRVLGVAPANLSDNTVIPVGRYEFAVKREALIQYPEVARIGVDVARYGRDYGTVYCRNNGRLWCEARIAQQNTNVYARRIKDLCRRLYKDGVRSLHIRVDGGGGFGGGVIDSLADDLPFIQEMVADGGELLVYEVHFNGTPYDERAYADLATEMYYDLGEALKLLKLDNPPNELQRDLTEREYRWWKSGGVDVKRLESKQEFRDRMRRLGQGAYSPDDGDGAALAASSDYLFENSRQAVYQLLDDNSGVSIGGRY